MSISAHCLPQNISLVHFQLTVTPEIAKNIKKVKDSKSPVVDGIQPNLCH